MRYKEICHQSRMIFLRNLREWIAKNGSQNVVYFDETGFKKEASRIHGWAQRGKKIYDKVLGNNRKMINLIMAQRGKEWLAPMLFDKSCTHRTVTTWVKECLLKELHPNSLVIMDNAPFHNKTHIKKILEEHGHTLLPLPTYSPDFNPIEQSFAILKKRRCFSGLPLENLLM
jgi:transposase